MNPRRKSSRDHFHLGLPDRWPSDDKFVNAMTSHVNSFIHVKRMRISSRDESSRVSSSVLMALFPHSVAQLLQPGVTYPVGFLTVFPNFEKITICKGSVKDEESVLID